MITEMPYCLQNITIEASVAPDSEKNTTTKQSLEQCGI